MAVEIPVIVDIDAAFKAAAKSVNTAIQPLQREVSQNALKLNITVGVDEEGNAIQKTFRQIKEGSINELNAIQTAISSVRMEMIKAAQAGDKEKFTALLEAKTYMEDMVRASQSLQLQMDGVAKTMSGLNARLAAARNALQNTRLNTDAWRAAADEVQRVTSKIKEAQKTLAERGTAAGSIDRINVKLRALTDQWNAMGRAEKFDKNGELSSSAKKVINEYRKVSDEAAKVGLSLEAAAKRAASGTKALEKNVRQVNTELETSNSRLAMLVTNALRLVAIHSASRFVRNVREVTAEFELQKVALGSIIQDTEKAQSLFKQIKAAAIESPFQIKELVTYTKQLSAYQIETEKLFGTTQKLADISAGLGVDMGRLILAFGQVRAAAVLRGQELRQFTEAGIPLVEKLAEKFSELNGRAVSTAEVFELISKRAVPFAMIEEIFNDLTSAGGAFYKMQEKQAETLLGQWNNLKDSISIMYDEIGNTRAVHSGMELLISDLKILMQNWRTLATIVGTLGIKFGILKVASWFIPILTTNTKMLEKAEVAYARAKRMSNMATQTGNKLYAISAKSSKLYAFYMLKAAYATTKFGRAIKSVVAVLSRDWLGIAVTALTLVIGRLIAARKEANLLDKELAKIENDGNVKIEQSVRNFERLAKTAVSAMDGSKEQREAVEELTRTYGDMLPASDKVVDKLREMNGEYGSLTRAIHEKINAQVREQKVEEIVSEFGTKIGRKRDTLKKILKTQGLSVEEVSSIMEQVEDSVKAGLISTTMSIAEQAQAIEKIIKDYTGKYIKLTKSAYYYLAGSNEPTYRGELSTRLSKAFSDVIKLYTGMNDKINEVEESMRSSVGVIGLYASEWKDMIKRVSTMPLEGSTDFEKEESAVKNYVDSAVKFIKEKFKTAEIDISKAFISGKPNFDVLTEAVEGIKDESAKASLRSIIAKFQKEYQKLAPSDQLRAFIIDKFKEISQETGISMDKFRSYIKDAGKDSSEYLKDLGESIEKYKKDAAELRAVMEQHYPARTAENAAIVKENEDMADALSRLYDVLVKFIQLKKTGGSSAQQDPFIILIQNRMKFMQDFQKGVEDLDDFMAHSAALGREQGVMRGRGLSLGIDTKRLKGDANELREWYSKAIDDVVKKIQSMGGKQFAGLGVTEILAKDLTGRKIQKYQELLQSLWKGLTDFDTSEMKKNFDKVFAGISDEIKRSDIARKFYQSVLDFTGDQELAASASKNIYGSIGNAFKENLQRQLNAAIATLDTGDVNLWSKLFHAAKKQDWDTILSNLDAFPKEWQKRLKQMAEDSRRFDADRISDLLKSLERAKTYGEKRVEIARKSQQRISQIEQLSVDDDTRARLLRQNAKKESEEIAKLQYDAFKESSMYVELFADLDAASERMLRNMRENLVAMKSEWKDLAPTELKELQSRINELDAQIAHRNPFKAMIDSIKEYRNMVSQKSRTQADEEAVAANDRAVREKALLDILTEEYNVAVREHGELSDQAYIAKDRMETQKETTDEAIDEAQAAQDVSNAYRDAAKHIQDAADEMKVWAGYVSECLDGVQQIVNTFASDDTSETVNILSEGLGKTLSGAAETASGAARVMAGDLTGIVSIVKGLGDLFSGIFGTAKSLQIKSLNKQIEKQEELLRDLEKTYKRLEDAMAEAFGTEYVARFEQALAVLSAKEKAYMKQAELERDKGKKKDKDKIEDYKDKAEEAAQELAKMRKEASSFFAGQDLASAAEAFSDAWLNAYAEFGDTAGAIEERMTEMVQTLVKKAALSGIAQQVLGDWYASLANVQDWNAQTIAAKWKEAMALVTPMVNGMQTFSAALQREGVSLRAAAGSFTGIARDVAGASEESINGLTTGINTQNFYISHIDQSVSRVLSILSGGTSGENTEDVVSMDPYKKQMLELVGNLPQMRDDMSSIRSLLEKVIKPVGTTSSHRVIIG